MLGNTKLGEVDGYMFVPDGNGALIYLDDKEGRFDSGYVQKVYGSDVGVGESYVFHFCGANMRHTMTRSRFLHQCMAWYIQLTVWDIWQ